MCVAMQRLEISKNSCFNNSVYDIGLEVGSTQRQDDVNFNGFAVMLRVGEVLVVREEK